MRTVGALHRAKIDVLFAGTFRSDQGAPLQANYKRAGCGCSRRRSAARQIAGTVQSINLIAPGRCGAIASTRSTSAWRRCSGSAARGTNVGVDIFNLVNSTGR
jgi:hypothetical protein